MLVSPSGTEMFQHCVRHPIRYSTSTRPAPEPSYTRLPPRTSPTPGLKWLRTAEPLEICVHIIALPRPFRVCNLTLPLLYTKSVFKPHPNAESSTNRLLAVSGQHLTNQLSTSNLERKGCIQGSQTPSSRSEPVTQER